MNLSKRIAAILLAILVTIGLAACNKDDDEVPLTTKRKQSNTTTTAPAIDIWAYLNGEGATAVVDDDTLGLEEPVGTTRRASSGSSSGNYTYEDIAVSFGGSDVFSSATTVAGGYPTFRWNAVSGAVRYNIYRSRTQNGTYSYLDSTTATSYTDRTAVSGTQYYYKVKAVKKVAATTVKTTTGTTKAPTTAATTRNTANAPQTAPKTYSTVSEIVSFYNTAANKVKTDAKSVTRNYRTIQYIDDENNSQTIKTLLALAGVKENTDKTPQTFSTPATIRDEFPVEGKNISSSLTADMVKSATCNYSKGYYNIIITLKNDPEKTVDYSGTCINVLNASAYFSGAKSETRGAQIQAKIYYDGSLDYVDQYAPTWVYADYNANDVVVNGQCALSIEEFWSIAY